MRDLVTVGIFLCAFLDVRAGRAVEITLPPETIFLKESQLPGYSLASGYCATCHSADYIRYQPSTFTRTFWKAEVTKMQKTFGAPIPDDAVDPIVDYLAKVYGAERPEAKAQ